MEKNFRGRARERLCYSFYINAASGLKEEFKDRPYKWKQIDNRCSVQDLSFVVENTIQSWPLIPDSKTESTGERALQWSSNIESKGRERAVFARAK